MLDSNKNKLANKINKINNQPINFIYLFIFIIIFLLFFINFLYSLLANIYSCTLVVLTDRQSIMIGFTELSEVEVKEIILQLGDRFAGNVYHVLNRWGVSWCQILCSFSWFMVLLCCWGDVCVCVCVWICMYSHPGLVQNCGYAMEIVQLSLDPKNTWLHLASPAWLQQLFSGTLYNEYSR